jgi:hypothetical protein
MYSWNASDSPKEIGKSNLEIKQQSSFHASLTEYSQITTEPSELNQRIDLTMPTLFSFLVEQCIECRIKWLVPEDDLADILCL